MKIDYFNDEEIKIDKSDWFASITNINPVLNGGIATYMFNYCYDKQKFISKAENGGFKDFAFVEGCKVVSIIQNLKNSNHTLNY